MLHLNRSLVFGLSFLSLMFSVASSYQSQEYPLNNIHKFTRNNTITYVTTNIYITLIMVIKTNSSNTCNISSSIICKKVYFVTQWILLIILMAVQQIQRISLTPQASQPASSLSIWMALSIVFIVVLCNRNR